MKWAINVLKAQIAWRKTDLNPRSASYASHKAHIEMLEKELSNLESSYRSICGDC